MKHLILVLLISTSILTTTHLETKTEHYDRLRIQDNLHLSTDSSDDTVRFILGQSLSDREKEARETQERELYKKYIDKQIAPSPSFTDDKSVKIIGYSQEQCVQYFKRVTGYKGSLGYAGKIRPNSSRPEVGAGALEARYGHISLIVAIKGDYLVLHDTNWIKGAITERVVPMNEMRGYLII